MPTWRFVVTVPRGKRGKNAGRPVPLASGNTRRGWQADAHRRKRHRTASHQQSERVRTALGLPPATAHRTVHFTLIRGPRQRILDVDNAHAGIKPYLDGLRDALWLVDDTAKWCTFTLSQCIDRALGPAILVEISE